MGVKDGGEGNIEYDWRQTEEDIYIDFNLNGEVKEEDVDLKLDTTAETCVCRLRFEDGSRWVCTLQHMVHKPSASVKVKDGALIIHLQKKEKFKEWKRLGDCAFSKAQHMEGGSNAANDKRNSSEGNSKVKDGGGEGEVDEGKEETEEYVVDHVKHDFFSRQDLKVLYLHVYVKKIKRDHVKVTFTEHEIAIKFKTNDNQFLQMNSGSTSDTLFCWRIRPWRAIDPEGCLYKVTKNNLEVNINKQKAEKWKALECSTKELGSGPRGRAASQGDWVPLSSSQSTTPTKESAEITKDAGSEKENMRGAVGGAKSVEINENLTRTKKPTCTVPPLSLGKQAQPLPAEPTPSLHLGYCGLDNLGNTCFMNSVLQVLANTRELKDFMLGADFKNEINRDNPLGSGGHLVLSFAVLMRRLWGGQNKSIAPSKLKSMISAKASQFMGFAQHDAQEFMAFLLDGLHEDINRIRKKPYTQTVDSDGRADQVVADEAWKTHRKRNDSFIVDLFQGQYKSKLVCPDCNKVSITFDPFMHLSMPLPKKKRHFPVYFFSRDCHQRPVKYVVSLSSDATVHELTVQVGLMAKVNAANLRVFEVHRSCIQKVFSRRSSLSGVSFNDIIFVNEVLPPAMAGESVVELSVIQRMLMPPALLRCSHCKKSCEKGRSLKRCTKCYRAAYCDQACQKSNWNTHRPACRRVPEPVGCPFIISLPKSHATYARLCQLMESYARYSTNVFVPPVKPPCSVSSPSHTSPNENEPHPSTSAQSQPPQSGDGTPHTAPADASRIPTSETAPESAEDDYSAGPGGKMEDNGIEESGLTKGEEDGLKEGATEKDETLRKGGGGEGDGAATATVVGQPQTQERKMPLFFIKPVNHIGNSIPSKDRLKDEGDNPIDLTGTICVAMDWRNDPKQENNVLVESRTLDYIEDESVCGKSYEETEITLNQCLNLFTEPEKLSPEEAWYCPKCKQHREATKQMLLWRLPSTLIIQLKRFSFGNMLWRDKIDKMVEYPVRGLDLSPYCHGTHSTPLIYDLYGVINHHGGILGGHYTSFARLASTADWSKNEHDWRLFDDNHVTNISEKNVVTRSAYLLFYRRRQPYTPYIWQAPSDPEPEADPQLEVRQDQENVQENVVDEPEDMDDKSSVSSSSSEMEVTDKDPSNAAGMERPGKIYSHYDNRFPSSSQPAAPVQSSYVDNRCQDREDIGYTDMEDID